MKFSYYPGCSLHSTGKEYGESTEAVCQALGIELVEIPDWNCCGASAAHSLNHELSMELSGRNLLLSQKQGMDIVVPCSACYHNLKLAEEELKLSDIPPIRHLLDILAKEIEKVKEMKKKSLSGLKVVPYYGCLITRPLHKESFDSVEQPQSMDRLLEACGCEVKKWSYKTDCCGGSLSLSQTPVVVNLVTKLINMAKQAGADCIVTACPMCQANLEMRQDGTNFPVFYFTEVMGMALEIDTNRWFDKHLISTVKLLEKISNTLAV